jgi:hypothetical protein
MGYINIIVTLIVFAVYVSILCIVLKKVGSICRKLVITIAVYGLVFGMLSCFVLTSLNIIEACFMDIRGPLHTLFVDPVQEEISKFAFFLLAYIFITRCLGLSGADLSEIRKAKSLVMLGVFVGLALAMLENLIGYSNLTVESTIIRTITTWPLHMITIGISAYGFNRYRITQKRRMVLGLLLLAIAIHIIFNTVS